MIGDPKPIQHHLREVLDLCGYRIVAGQALGTLDGLVVDAETWKVTRFVVGGRGEQESLPVESFRSIDDTRRALDVELPGERPGTHDSPRTDASASAQPVQTSAMIGKNIDGRDGPAGRIADLLVNVNVWELRYLVIESGSRRVLTDIEWCSSVDGGGSRPRIDLPVAAIDTAPAYEALAELCSGYEEALYRHYTNRAYMDESDVA